jgi:hypothetical protein
MMTMTDPITPPPELLNQWCMDFYELGDWRAIAAQAAQWGADQELEACCEWLCEDSMPKNSNRLRNARRPKPPSLKEQAQVELGRLIALIPSEGALAMAEPIRRALEALDD